MKYMFTAVALLAATVVADKRDLCTDGSVDDGGNWYCQDVKAITYTGIGSSGSYNRVTDMASDGTCSSTPQAYSGAMSPLDEEISLHFRGPIQLKQFAAYTPSTASKSKRSAARMNAHKRRHAHAHAQAHGHQHQAREAAVGDIVTATINGVVVSWTNEYTGVAATSAAVSSAAATSAAAVTTSAASSAASSAATYSAAVSVVENIVVAASSSSSSAAAASSSVVSTSDSTSSGSGWTRGAYYSSTKATSEGLVFLNHNGGSGSGVFDYNFGNSLSYSSADGCEGASSSTLLDDVTIPSSGEVVIMTDSECTGDACGYSRPGTVAYHGFDGASKVFFFEFQMPDSGETAATEYDAVNMPAIWFLNAQIPRTLQYGSADCSCWTTGCGEFDIFEVLAAGDKRAKSTLHTQNAGGDSDYFDRPETAAIQVVMVMDNDNIHIKILDTEVDFSSTISADYIDDIISGTLTQTKTVSLFTVSK